MKDLCLTCGQKHEPETWGAFCDCFRPNVVHQQQCDGCKKTIGQITDDDYCEPEKLYCPACLDKCRKEQKKHNTTLDETWENCLAMWKWIAEVYGEGESNVESLKQSWLRKFMPDVEVVNNCFFCDYAMVKTDYCKNCPGKLVDGGFDCHDSSYHFDVKPKQFYQKLLELDTKREGKDIAELKCGDGTVIQISRETEEELRTAFGPKPGSEPTYKVKDVFWRDQAAYYDHHYLRLCENSDGMVGLCDLLDGLAIHDRLHVKDINAITLDEVREMTFYPAGLRHVPVKNLVISER